ncbi:protein tyrosine phosphatase type IVA 1-like protein [Cricetulus griseus]|nr:protein tyrosine phosphatase type IVA 1-like protein [Cricetulus griseus]
MAVGACFCFDQLLDEGSRNDNEDLGRAPVLVALPLIEGGMKYEDAVQFIRQKQHGDFNSKQLLYLEKYHPKMWLHCKDSNGHRNNCDDEKLWIPSRLIRFDEAKAPWSNGPDRKDEMMEDVLLYTCLCYWLENKTLASSYQMRRILGRGQREEPQGKPCSYSEDGIAGCSLIFQACRLKMDAPMCKGTLDDYPVSQLFMLFLQFWKLLALHFLFTQSYFKSGLFSRGS